MASTRCRTASTPSMRPHESLSRSFRDGVAPTQDAMHGNEMSTNVEFALDNLKYRKDGKFDFEEFKGMHHLYPSVLFPAFRSAAQRRTLSRVETRSFDAGCRTR